MKEPETVTPEVTATPEPTQETSPAQEAETTAAPTQQVTPEPTQEAAVQEQHKEAEVNDAETASDTGNSDYVIPDSSTRYLTLSLIHRSDRSFRMADAYRKKRDLCPSRKNFQVG